MNKNRQFGFIVASIVLAPFYVITRFALIVCITNVIFDLFLAKKHLKNDIKINYNQNIKLSIFIISAVINLIIMSLILKDFNSSIIIYNYTNIIMTYIIFTIGLRLNWIKSILFHILLLAALFGLYLAGLPFPMK